MNITQEMKEQEEQVKTREVEGVEVEGVKEQTIEANTAQKFLIETFLKPERLTDETQEMYKLRQKANKLYLKFKKKGQMLWLSKDVSQMIKGTTFSKEKFIQAMKAFEEAQAKKFEESGDPKAETK